MFNQTCCRYGTLTGTSSMKEGPFSVNENARGMPKNELEKLSFLRDATPGLCKERTVTKGNNNKYGTSVILDLKFCS